VDFDDCRRSLAGWFISKEAPQFIIVEMVVALLLISRRRAGAKWPSAA